MLCADISARISVRDRIAEATSIKSPIKTEICQATGLRKRAEHVPSQMSQMGSRIDRNHREGGEIDRERDLVDGYHRKPRNRAPGERLEMTADLRAAQKHRRKSLLNHHID